MMNVTPEQRKIWLETINPNPLPPSWIEGKIVGFPRTIEAHGTRECCAVSEGAERGLFVIHAWTVSRHSNATNTYSISYPQPKQQALL